MGGRGVAVDRRRPPSLHFDKSDNRESANECKAQSSAWRRSGIMLRLKFVSTAELEARPRTAPTVSLD